MVALRSGTVRVVCLVVAGLLGAPAAAPAARVVETYARTPLRFEVNQGQAPADVAFIGRAAGYQVALTPSETLLVLTPQAPRARVMSAARTARPAGEQAGRDREAAALRLRLAGGRPGTLAGAEPLATRVNLYVGSDPTRWRRGIPTFARVRVVGVYPGIDVIYYGTDRRLEFDLVVGPGADPGRIGLVLEAAPGGATPTAALDSAGDVLVDVGGRALRLGKPIAHQEIDGARRPVEARYVIERDGAAAAPRLAFQIGGYDRARPLVIDPIVEYAVHLGGAPADEARGIAVTADASAYVAGSTASTDVPGAIGSRGAGLDAFVARLDAAGTVQWVTYFGGDGDDEAAAIAADPSGRALVAGTTDSANLPTQAPYQGTAGGGTDAFVAGVDADGIPFYATYLGGTGADRGLGIAVDTSGNAYVAGVTESADFPVSASGALAGTRDAFVAKLDPAVAGAASRIYARLLGGGGLDEAHGVGVDAKGAAYVVGWTESADFPTTPVNAFRATPVGGRDAFVTQIAPDGLSLAYSTYLGGAGEDAARAVAAYGEGLAAVTGSTASADFPVTTAAFQRTSGGGVDAFVAMINTTRLLRRSLGYSTHLGGAGRDAGHGVAVNADRHFYVAGATESADFPARHAVAGPGGGTDAFVAKLVPQALSDLSLVYATPLGGAGVDEAAAIAVDVAGDAYVAGLTGSATFPGVIAGTPPGGPQDGFVAKLTEADLVVVELTAPRSAIQGEAIVVEAKARNAGGMESRPTRLGFVIRPADKTLGPETPVEILGGDPSIPALRPGTGHSTGPITLRIPAGPEGPGRGRHHLSAIVDPDNSVPEALEGNNRRRVGIEIRPDGVDLTVAALSFPSRTSPGATIQVTDTTENIGDAAAGASVTAFWLSPTSTQGHGSIKLAARTVGPLATKAADQQATAVTIPPGTVAGNYFILAVANSGDEPVRDVNADNNLRARKITIGADLTLEAVNVLTSGGGGIIDVRDTTTNLFAGPAAATVTGFYLSTKPTLSGSLGRIGERTIPEFTGRGRSKGKSTLEVPGTVAAGTYYLVGRADDTGALTEVDEGNNLLAVPVQIGPDLIVSRLVAPPSAPRGTEITASNRVRNRGHTRAGESTVAFALARGANCDEDVRPLTTREAGPLDPAVESRAETKVGLPATLDPGDYCIVATADSGNAVTEVLEGNNRQAVRLTVQ